jgi:hypothetical protein
MNTATAYVHAPQQGPMEFDVLRRYLARAHNNSQDRASRWGHRPTSAYLEAWNWCNDTEAGRTTARPSWLAQRAISAVTEVCPLNFA